MTAGLLPIKTWKLNLAAAIQREIKSERILTQIHFGMREEDYD